MRGHILPRRWISWFTNQWVKMKVGVFGRTSDSERTHGGLSEVPARSGPPITYFKGLTVTWSCQQSCIRKCKADATRPLHDWYYGYRQRSRNKWKISKSDCTDRDEDVEGYAWSDHLRLSTKYIASGNRSVVGTRSAPVCRCAVLGILEEGVFTR